MIKSISGKIKAKAALIDPNHYGRSDTSALGRWFWEIDKVLLLLISVLIAIGLIAVAAASPAASQRYSGGNVHFHELYYFWRQLLWIAVGIPVMIWISTWTRERARRLSLVGAAFFFVLLIFVPVIGPEVNGARRWVNFGLGQVQPSEFLKPFFVVSMAWLLSLREADKSLPVYWISAVVTGGIAFLLMKQPDFGSTIIFCAVWVVMLALAGVSIRLLAALAVAGIIGVVLAYFFYDVATLRIDEFLFGTGDTFQTDNAMRTLTAGGLFGMGPGGGTEQVRPARAAHRLHLLGDRRGVRADRLPRHRRALSRHRRARAGQAARRGQQLRDPRRRRAGDRVRAAGADQHDGQRPARPVQGHDPAVHQLRRLVDAGFVDRHGLAARLHSAQPVSHAFTLCREVERGEADHMNFVLAAGGTGGHMVPAHALAAELHGRRHGVLLITDVRGARFPGLFENIPLHVLPAGRAWRRADQLAARTARCRQRPRRGQTAVPRAPARRGDRVRRLSGVPALLAASAMRIPTVLHEQNAVLGRVNRLLAGEAEAIATAYEQVERLKPKYARKAVLVGNPVREEIARLGELPFPPFDETAPLKILVTGGSQGATVLGRVVPDGLGMLQTALRHRLQVVQQCRPEDIERVRAQYAELGIPAELLTYIEDMPEKLADAHLFIGRAGASTIAELTAAGRPAILIPYPAATDDHQITDRQRRRELHRRRDRQRRQYRQPCLQRDHRHRVADRQSGQPAERHARHGL